MSLIVSLHKNVSTFSLYFLCLKPYSPFPNFQKYPVFYTENTLKSFKPKMVNLLKYEKSIIETPNGFIQKKHKKISKSLGTSIEFSHRFRMGNKYVPIAGNITMTVSAAKEQMGCPCTVFLVDNGRYRKLEESERPFRAIFTIEKSKIELLNNPKIVIEPIIKESQPMWKNFYFNLKKLIIKNILIKEISLECQKSLQYKLLSNLGLEKFTGPNQILEHCDLSRNKLCECYVKSKVLILKSNRIENLTSEYHFNHLNISNNPLCQLNCHANVLYIRNTCIKHPLSSDAYKLVADSIPNLILAACPRLIYLSINNGNIRKIRSLPKLKYLKARNNLLEYLPKLSELEYADVEGNFLTEFRFDSICWASLAKNNLTNIDLSKSKNLKGIDLSFNSIDHRITLHELARCKCIRADQNLIQKSKMFKSKIFKGHSCKKTKIFAMKYILKILVYGNNITVLVVQEIVSEEDLYDKLVFLLGKCATIESVVMIIEKFVRLANKLFTDIDPEHRTGFVLISSKLVLIESYGLDMLYWNYVGCKTVGRNTGLVGFVKALKWCIIPIFCPTHQDIGRRAYKLNKEYITYGEFFRFLDFYCPLSLEYVISNGISEIPFENTTIISRHKYEHTFVAVYKELHTSKVIKEPGIDAYRYIDFGLGFYHSFQNSNFLDASEPVFAFMKFYYNCDLNPILAADNLNVMNIIDSYVRIFCGRYIEKNYRLCIVGFNSTASAVLWGLRMKKTFRLLGINVGIGITVDVVFMSEYDGKITYGGPAFNKLSRIVDLGTGIFISDNRIVRMVDEGTLILKGYSGPSQIYSLHLKRRGFF